MKFRVPAFLSLLSMVALPLAAQHQGRTDPGIAENVRGETINSRPNLNDQKPLNRAPALNERPSLDRAAEIKNLPIHEVKKQTPGVGPSRPVVAISIGEDKAPTQTQLALVHRADRAKVPLADLARDWKRQRELERASSPRRKRWVIEEK